MKKTSKRVLQLLLVIILCVIGVTSYFIAQKVQPIVDQIIIKKENKNKALDTDYVSFGAYAHEYEIYATSIYNNEKNNEGAVFVTVYTSSENEMKIRVVMEEHMNSSWSTTIGGGGESFDYLPEIMGKQLYPYFLDNITIEKPNDSSNFDISTAYDFKKINFSQTNGKGIALSDFTARRLGLELDDIVRIGNTDYVLAKILTPVYKYDATTYASFYQKNIIELPFILFESSVEEENAELLLSAVAKGEAINRVFVTGFEDKSSAEKYLSAVEKILED